MACAALAASAAAAADFDQAAQETIVALQQAIEQLRARDTARRDKQAEERGEIVEISAELTRLAAQLEELERLRDEFQVDVETLAARNDRQRANRIAQARANAAGERIGRLQLANGDRYEGAVITAVTDAGLEIRHLKGTARIRCDELGPEWSERFEWDPEQLIQLLAQEQQDAADLDQAVAAAQQARDAKAAKLRERERATRTRPQPAIAGNQLPRTRLHEPRRPVGRQGASSIYYYNLSDVRGLRTSPARRPPSSGIWKVGPTGRLQPMSNPSSSSSRPQPPVSKPAASSTPPPPPIKVAPRKFTP